MKWVLFLGLLLLVGCTTTTPLVEKEINLSGKEVATFAGGCFWCMEAAFQQQNGVEEVFSGYAGGTTENPNYEHIGDYKESVQVYYDPKIISYEELLKLFWVQIDPLDAEGQFSDRGNQYKTIIFYHTEEQRLAAEMSKKEIANKFDKPIVTEILSFTNFYDAEEYHQDYYLKQASQYNLYKKYSGREFNIEKNEKLLSD